MKAVARLLWLSLTAVALTLPVPAAQAQLQLTPQTQPAKKSESGIQKRQDAKKKSAPKKETKSSDKSKAPPAAQPAPEDPNVDLVYGAYQRFDYRTAFRLATQRAQELGDPKAMT